MSGKLKTRSVKIVEPNNGPNCRNDANISMTECVLLSNLPSKWKWIARDRNGDLFIFMKKPYKTDRNNYWTTGKTTDYMTYPYRSLFKFIKWSDNDPVNIDKIIVAKWEKKLNLQNR